MNVPSLTSKMSAGPVGARYGVLVETGAIERDPAQAALVARLDALAEELNGRAARKAGALARLFGLGRDDDAPRGLYVWGAVGRGKTMLMDLFFEALDGPSKRRAHFHGFMADVHERVFAYRQRIKSGEAKDGDPLPHVARDLAAEARVLCFDEFAVTDIADAMILARLFTALFAEGVTMVATSNVEPMRLYEGGLNRALFLPFLRLLDERVEVVKLDARTDFRLEKLGGRPVWYVPGDATAGEALDAAFTALAGTAQGKPVTLDVKGHKVEVPQAAAGVARFTFSDLCARAYGASDYRAIAERFHTIILDGIPRLDFARRNEAKRFITLIDVLYDRHVKLIASAEAEPDELYQADHGAEAFEFARTASRLIEMRSEVYLAMPHGQADSAASGTSTGIVET